MDAQTTQLRQQITQTRAAMAATLDLLERRVSQKVAATVDKLSSAQCAACRL
jgi:hypothetical protein